MKFQERDSGLVVPVESKPASPPQPTRRYGPLEIHDQDKRKIARDGLLKLWDAMNLSNPDCGITLLDNANTNYDTYKAVYRFVGEMLLGEDCPEKEVKC